MKIAKAVLATIVAFSLGACAAEAVDSTQAQQTQSCLSGEEIYKGMFFGVGPAAGLYPEIWEHPMVMAKLADSESANPAARTQVADFSLDYIASRDATFIQRFGDSIVSGNLPMMSELISQAAEYTKLAAMEYQGADPQRALANAKVSDSWLYQNEVVAVDYYIAGVVAAVVAIVITQIDVTPVAPEMMDSELRYDEWVESAATKPYCVNE